MLIAITVVSLLVAIAMTWVAWRLAQAERRRSDARVAALAAEIHRDPLADLPIYRAESIVQRPALRAPVTDGNPMFAAAPAAARSRVAAASAAGVFVVGSGAALAVVLGGPSASSRVAADVASASPATAAPLELVALGHERDGDALSVHGTIRNPATSNEIDGLDVVVFLYRRDGGLATSTRAPVVPAAVVPGGEATFRVVVPDAAVVARYRVSFRTSQQVVAHVDRRGNPRD